MSHDCESDRNNPLPPEIKLSKFQQALRALHYRNYRFFFIGQLISLVGTWMQTIAQSWLVYGLTGSSLLLGTVGFASQIPIFLLAFMGGAAADRFNRHRVVIATQSASMVLAFILAFLTLTRTIRVEHVIVLAVLLGIVNALDIPTRNAFIVTLVDKKDFINAIALNSTIFNGARVAGPAIAGLLIAGIGEGWCFFANAVSYIAVIAGLLMMKVDKTESVTRERMDFSSLREGIDYARRVRPILYLLLFIAMASVFGMPYSVLMPVFAKTVLHGNAGTQGFMMGCTGLGALIGSMVLASRSGVKGLERFAAYQGAVFGASLILFSLSKTLWLSAIFLVPVGFSLMSLMACSNTLIQSMTPDRLRGRMMGLHVMMFMGMTPFGSIFSGAVADHIGAPLTVLIGGAVCLAGAIVFYVKQRGLSFTAPSEK